MDTTRSLFRVSATLVFTLLLSACPLDNSEDTLSLDGSSGPLSIILTNPPGASAITTPDFVVNITGTVSSETEIDRVNWKNSRGGSGKANGKDNWATGNIVLSPGINEISITATDVAGDSATKTISVERATQAPGAGGIGGAGGADGADSDDGIDSVTTLSWEAPTTRDDQTPLTNLAGYVVYYGQRSGEYGSRIVIDDPEQTVHVVDNLSPGTWYFSVASLDANGLESNTSSEVMRAL